MKFHVIHARTICYRMKVLFTHKVLEAALSAAERPVRGAWLPGLVPGREGVQRGGCLLAGPRLCAGLRAPLEMVLVWAGTLHSKLLIPWFPLCLMPLWSQLKSLYLFNL